MSQENLSLGFPTRSDTNQAVQPQKMARGLKFGLKKKRDCAIYEAKTMALISCAVTAQLICAFVFTYAKSRFSRNVAHDDSTVLSILSGLETRSLGFNTLGTTDSSVHGFLGLTSTKQWVNVTCSRPQQTVPRPGLEPGTPWSVVRIAYHCASLPH